MSESEIQITEHELLGFYVTGHPLSSVAPQPQIPRKLLILALLGCFSSTFVITESKLAFSIALADP